MAQLTRDRDTTRVSSDKLYGALPCLSQKATRLIYSEMIAEYATAAEAVYFPLPQATHTTS